MMPFQPGEQVHVVVVECLPTYDLGDDDQPWSRRLEPAVYTAVAKVLPGGTSAQLMGGSKLQLREGFVFQDAYQAVDAAFDIGRRIRAGEPLYP